MEVEELEPKKLEKKNSEDGFLFFSSGRLASVEGARKQPVEITEHKMKAIRLNDFRLEDVQSKWVRTKLSISLLIEGLCFQRFNPSCTRAEHPSTQEGGIRGGLS